MELFEAIRNRRSIRRYVDKPVSDQLILQVIEAGTWAPSAHNQQPWAFVVVKHKEILTQIAEKSKYAKFLPQAAVAIVVCANFSYQRNRLEEKGVEYYSVQDSAAAIQNMLLAAHGMGMGTCWIGDVNEVQLRDLLKVPVDFAPVGIVAIGWPEADINPKAPPRKPLPEVVCWEQFGEN